MSSISRFIGWAARGAGIAAALAPRTGHAHIKWFCAYDTTVPPLPLHEVVTPAFVAVSVGFSALIFIALVVDRWFARTSVARRLEDVITRGHAHATLLIRVAAGILFVVLWQDGTTILTPELKTTNGIVPWVQLAIAVCMLSRTTLILGAAGIMGLYAYAVAEYGAFHMM